MADLTNRIQQIIATTRQQKAEQERLAKERELKKARARREFQLKQLANNEEVFDAEELDPAYLEGVKKASKDVVIEEKADKLKIRLKTKKSFTKNEQFERLHKVIARVGLASVRKAEQMIVDGRVSVNGQLATLGQKVNVLDRSLKIRVDGVVIPHVKAIQQPCRVLIYNKAEGELSTRQDTEGRMTVFDRLPRLNVGRWIQVGRLDANTSGLLLFTNDGELANRLMHPSYQIERKYLCRVYGEVSDEVLFRLKKGVMLDDGMAKFDNIRRLAPQNEDGEYAPSHSNQWFEVTLSEGRNHEVRRLWESQELVVSRLKRVEYANINLDRSMLVPQGGWLEADLNEINMLRGLVGLKPETEGFRPGNYGHTNSELKRQKNKQYREIKGAIRKDSIHRSQVGHVLDERNSEKREKRQQLVNVISYRNKQKFGHGEASFSDSDDFPVVEVRQQRFGGRNNDRSRSSSRRDDDRRDNRRSDNRRPNEGRFEDRRTSSRKPSRDSSFRREDSRRDDSRRNDSRRNNSRREDSYGANRNSRSSNRGFANSSSRGTPVRNKSGRGTTVRSANRRGSNSSGRNGF